MLGASDCDGLSDCIWSALPKNNILTYSEEQYLIQSMLQSPWGELLLSNRWILRKEQQWTMWYLTFTERTQVHSRRCQIWSEAAFERITQLIIQSFHVLLSNTQAPWANSDGAQLSMLDLPLLRSTRHLTMDLSEIFPTKERLWERLEWGELDTGSWED